MTSSHRSPGRIRVHVNFLAYPIQSSLGVLGRKWALLVLTNIAIGRAQRFNDLRRQSPGMSKRILAMRLRELEASGFIARAEQHRGYTLWHLTPKGADVLPVILTLLHFGSKWGEPGRSPEGAARPWGRDFEVVVHRTIARKTANAEVGAAPSAVQRGPNRPTTR